MNSTISAFEKDCWKLFERTIWVKPYCPCFAAPWFSKIGWMLNFTWDVYMRPEMKSNRYEISNRFEIPFTCQFTWRFHCGNFPNNSKALLHMCKWYLLINANLINAAGIYCLHGKLTVVWNFTPVNLTEVKFAPYGQYGGMINMAA